MNDKPTCKYDVTTRCSRGDSFCYSATYLIGNSIQYRRGCGFGVAGKEKETSCRNNSVCYFVRRKFKGTSCTGTCCRTVKCNKDVPPFNRPQKTLRCYQCNYNSAVKKSPQKCATVKCQTGYCFTEESVDFNNVTWIVKGCDFNERYCPNATVACGRLSKKFFLKKCSGKCCSTDLCNTGVTSLTNVFVFLLIVILNFLFYTIDNQ